MLHWPNEFHLLQGIPVSSAVRVCAPGRLHMGFLDLNGSLGRRFGSVGLALEDIRVRLRAAPSATLQVHGPQAQRARRYAETFIDRMGISHGVSLEIDEIIPEHVGLGSGTQLALAVGAALNELFACGHSVRAVAALHERGQRSGIGVGAFERGGFVVDGGRGEDDGPPPVIAHLAFPEAWRIVLIQDETRNGLHGEDEIRAFRALPPLSEESCGQLCRVLLMQIAPALAEGNLDAFGRGIAYLQRVIGDHFAPAQGGRFASPPVARALEWCERQGFAGIGQSSWGPTGFAFVPDEQTGARLMRSLDTQGLSVRVLKARNRGAEVVFDGIPGARDT